MAFEHQLEGQWWVWRRRLGRHARWRWRWWAGAHASALRSTTGLCAVFGERVLRALAPGDSLVDTLLRVFCVLAAAVNALETIPMELHRRAGHLDALCDYLPVHKSCILVDDDVGVWRKDGTEELPPIRRAFNGDVIPGIEDDQKVAATWAVVAIRALVAKGTKVVRPASATNVHLAQITVVDRWPQRLCEVLKVTPVKWKWLSLDRRCTEMEAIREHLTGDPRLAADDLTRMWRQIYEAPTNGKRMGISVRCNGSIVSNDQSKIA